MHLFLFILMTSIFGRTTRCIFFNPFWWQVFSDGQLDASLFIHFDDKYFRTEGVLVYCTCLLRYFLAHTVLWSMDWFVAGVKWIQCTLHTTSIFAVEIEISENQLHLSSPKGNRGAIIVVCVLLGACFMSMLVIYKYRLVLHTCASVSTFALMLPLRPCVLVLECKGKRIQSVKF